MLTSWLRIVQYIEPNMTTEDPRLSPIRSHYCMNLWGPLIVHLPVHRMSVQLKNSLTLNLQCQPERVLQISSYGSEKLAYTSRDKQWKNEMRAKVANYFCPKECTFESFCMRQCIKRELFPSSQISPRAEWDRSTPHHSSTSMINGHASKKIGHQAPMNGQCSKW